MADFFITNLTITILELVELSDLAFVHMCEKCTQYRVNN